MNPLPIRAFAPGRVNLIGEHTGLQRRCLPPVRDRVGRHCDSRVAQAAARWPRRAWETAIPSSAAPSPSSRAAGLELPGCSLDISSDLPQRAGLASSAALCVSLVLALCAVADAAAPPPVELARLCSRIENEYAGAQTGLARPARLAARAGGSRPAARHADAQVGGRPAGAGRPCAGGARLGRATRPRRLRLQRAPRRVPPGGRTAPGGIAERRRRPLRAPRSARPSRSPRAERERARGGRGRRRYRSRLAGPRASCSTRRTRASATTTRSRCPRWSAPSPPATRPGRSARASWAAASAAPCWRCSRPRRRLRRARPPFAPVPAHGFSAKTTTRGPATGQQEHPHRPDRGRGRGHRVRTRLGSGARLLMADEVHVHHAEAKADEAGEPIHLPGAVLPARGPGLRARPSPSPAWSSTSRSPSSGWSSRWSRCTSGSATPAARSQSCRSSTS